MTNGCNYLSVRMSKERIKLAQVDEMTAVPCCPVAACHIGEKSIDRVYLSMDLSQENLKYEEFLLIRESPACRDRLLSVLQALSGQIKNTFLNRSRFFSLYISCPSYFHFIHIYSGYSFVLSKVFTHSISN